MWVDGWVQLEHRVVTTCFNCLTKMSPVVKVSSKTVKNWSRYLMCSFDQNIGLLPLVLIVSQK